MDTTVNDVPSGSGDSPPWWLTQWMDSLSSPDGTVNVSRLPAGILTNFLGQDEGGALAAQYPDGHWELAPLWVRALDEVDKTVADAWQGIKNQVSGAEASFSAGYAQGQAIGDTITNTLDPTQAISAAVRSSVPWWFWLAAGAVVYGIGVQVGLLPPLGRLLKAAK